MLKVGAGLPLTVQLKVTVTPAVIPEGLAVKEVTLGGAVGAAVTAKLPPVTEVSKLLYSPATTHWLVLPAVKSKVEAEVPADLPGAPPFEE